MAVINSIDGVGGTTSDCGSPEIATGSRDGSVMVWDVRQKDTPVAKFVAPEGASMRDCWAVAFGNSYNNEERVLAAGYDNGDVKLFDLKNMSVRWSKCLKNGVDDTKSESPDDAAHSTDSASFKFAVSSYLVLSPFKAILAVNFLFVLSRTILDQNSHLEIQLRSGRCGVKIEAN
ncbi:hypothetical protein JTB14_006748 [Gonioctena quinquepunctata]|nr:hypothetical protein JTB14_006748 [Gonioctena quinquepunctata]